MKHLYECYSTYVNAFKVTAPAYPYEHIEVMDISKRVPVVIIPGQDNVIVCETFNDACTKAKAINKWLEQFIEYDLTL